MKYFPGAGHNVYILLITRRSTFYILNGMDRVTAGWATGTGISSNESQCMRPETEILSVHAHKFKW